MKKNLKIALLSFLILPSFLLSGCSLPWTSKQNSSDKGTIKNPPVLKVETPSAQGAIKKFDNYDDLASFLEEGSFASSYQGRGDVGGLARGMVMNMDGMAVSESLGLGNVATKQSAPTSPASSGSDDFSKTNVQVEGVDESDIVKSDGEYIYSVSANNLFIIKAFPADKMEVVSRIEFESRPRDIYISGDRLVIFGDNQLIYKSDIYGSFGRQNQFTFLKIFDITDRKNPKQVKGLDFEGFYFNSRLIGDHLYFVTNNYNYYYSPTDPILPRLLEDGQEVSSDCGNNAKCFAPGAYYFDIPYDSYNFVQISSVNIKNPKENVKGELYVLPGGQGMYVSRENIYISYTKYTSEYQLMMEVLKETLFSSLPSSQQERIAEIERAKYYILNNDEKMGKISSILERYMRSLPEADRKSLEEALEKRMKERYKDLVSEMEKTFIHKIAIKGGEMEYKTFASVSGSVLNQFSMDEFGGHFRIATTKNRSWSQYADKEDLQSYSNVYVLDEGMKVVGKLEGLAKEESIFSARFMGNRLYLVTFVQVDPLFAIDLSDPKNPKVLGELKVPGFSNYLHPYNENLLIGFGKDTDLNEHGGVITKGLKLSLFDVSSVGDPKEVDTYIIGGPGSDSIALHDHKAFLFSAEKNLLSVPASLSEDVDGRGWGRTVFSGALVFGVDENGFELKGKIDHSDGGKESPRDCWWGYCYYDNNVLRSLYIGENLYTYSNKYLKANSLNDLQEINTLPLKKDKTSEDDFTVIN